MSEECFDECIICGEPLNMRILLPCDHYNFCIKCYERLSRCYHERKCPFCQSEVTSDPIITNSKEIGTYAVESLKRRSHDRFYNVFFDKKEQIKAVAGFRKITCQECGEIFKSYGQLKNHAAKEHKKQVCKICFDSQRFLPCETELFPKQQYNQHVKQHPKCPICPYVGFDHEVLNVHMRENHFRCDICAAQGKESWFETIELIAVHFHTDHFACQDPACVMQGFIVFATKAELLAHRVQVHHDNPSILNEAKNKDDPNEPKEEDDTKQRHLQMKKRFKAAIKREFANEPKKCFDLENIIYQINNNKLSVSDFCEQYKKIAGDSANKLFVETVSVVFDPEIRVEVVKGLQDIRSCSIPRMHVMHASPPKKP